MRVSYEEGSSETAEADFAFTRYLVSDSVQPYSNKQKEIIVSKSTPFGRI